MRVLVTGSGGYIGAVLAPYLARAGHEVVGLDSLLFADCTFGAEPEPVETLAKDIRDVRPEDLDGFDAVVHLAAISNDPLDPAYLAWQVRRDVGHQFRILEQAQDVNAQMPGWVARRIGEALNEHAKPLKGARVLVLGVAYKPDVGDVRESPSLRVMAALARHGVKLSFHDPFVDAVEVDGRRRPGGRVPQVPKARSPVSQLR